MALLSAVACGALAQTPVPTPTPDKRGLGIESSGAKDNTQTGQQSREAKPELVLQTGYNNFFGATRLVFSPDGRLLATATFRSSTIKLWDTASGRELRNLSSGKQSGMGMSPAIAFSRDSRFIAAAAGENTVKVWEVISGREVQTLTSGEGGLASSIAGIYFIAFSSNDRLVTISDAIRVWDITSAKALSTIASDTLNTLALMGGEGGVALSLDGTQLARLSTASGDNKVQVWDLATSRELRAVNLPDKDLDSADMAFTADGHVLVAGIVDKRVKLWDVTSRANERELGSATQLLDSSNSVAMRGCYLSEGYTRQNLGRRERSRVAGSCLRLTVVSLPQRAASSLVSVTTGKSCHRRLRHADYPLGHRHREAITQAQRPHKHGLQGRLQRRRQPTFLWRPHALGSTHRPGIATHRRPNRPSCWVFPVLTVACSRRLRLTANTVSISRNAQRPQTAKPDASNQRDTLFSASASVRTESCWW